MRFTSRLGIGLLGAVCAVVPAGAAIRTHSVTVENDTLANTDRSYTQGLQYQRIGERDNLPRWSRWLFRKATLCVDDDSEDTCYWVDSGFLFGQLIYTPEDIDDPNLIPDDRPYGGLLYGGTVVRLTNEKGTRVHRLELDLGVTGEPSLAEDAQKGFHEIIGSREPMGWDHQLDTRIGVTLQYDLTLRILQFEGAFNAKDVRYFDFVPHLGATVGTLFDYANVGFTTRLGWNLSGLLPETIAPVGFDPGNVEAYVFGRVDARGVLYNYFIEGSSAHTIDAESFVNDVQWGGVLRIGGYKLSYIVVTRSPEYTPAGRQHRYASVTFAWSRRR